MNARNRRWLWPSPVFAVSRRTAVALGRGDTIVHMVMGPSARGTPVRFRVRIDGQPPGGAHGVDIDEQGNGVLAEQRLHQLIRQPKPIVDRQFEIEFLDAGAEAFAFTFG